jgi:hypothetical protein
MRAMSIDRSAAADFMATHARVLDRRRFALLNGDTDVSAVLAALDGYRNADGGYGWGLEPDLRSPESQPGAAHHAFEVFDEIAPATAPQAVTAVSGHHLDGSAACTSLLPPFGMVASETNGGGGKGQPLAECCAAPRLSSGAGEIIEHSRW